MDLPLPLAMAALGLASGLHCVGMCGGIVTAFAIRGQSPNSLRVVLFNAGRLSTYAAAGALAGGLGALGWYASGGQMGLQLLASAVLVLVGLHLAGVRRPMLWAERIGAPLWRRLQPLAARTFRKTDLASAYGAGLVWGALPCGLVYAALVAAAFAATPVLGAVAMLSFGLGTLPWLAAAGVLTARLRGQMARRGVRLAVGGTVLGFGAWGLAQAAAIHHVF